MNKKVIFLSLGLILSLGLVGCNYPVFVEPTSQLDALNTAAAQTIQANQTQIMQTNQAINQVPTATATLEPVAETATPTSSPEPTFTPTITPTATTKVACDQAQFISETIPDGTDFSPGETFTKTWTLKNVGSCIWDSEYDVVFVEGNAMNVPASKQLTTGTIEPGQSIQISLDLKAPNASGTHRGDFKLRNASGAIFGIGEGNKTFWVKIDVAGTVYDFTKNVCASGVVWRSSAGILPCPGSTGDSNGYVRKIENPVLENGVIDNEPGLHVHPEMVNDGWIKGNYPEIAVTEGVYFTSIIGCNGNSNCDVRFRLSYKIEGGDEETLATWHEVQDSTFNRVKVDLSSLAGKKVQFILVVLANGNYANDNALWFGPRIEP